MSGARERIAWAADVPLDEALRLWPLLSPWVGVVKVGLSLFVEHGPAAVRAFRDQGASVFLDLKLHDIPNTVERAATGAAALGVTYLTVHASGGENMLRAALRGAATGASAAGVEPPVLLGVTTLTSLGDREVGELGFGGSARQMADRLAAVAVRAGLWGLVCSPQDARQLKMNPGVVFLCTPGVRPGGSDAADQARTETPAAAIAAGADLLVVGRPLHAARDPAAAARALHTEVAATLG
ncbi:MAG TPA: orotidine-5'-phosphate decarboxylase [Myxococcaceae bacterium]|nr:orotidine-5'-phosphate decarboxylase [Myxococcaceae bacterium]